ncbi:MAG: twin-arginine translocase subunit TatC [Halobacteriaceae archaeon]
MAGSIDEDTARTINEGRATLGAGLRAIQRHLQKVFIVFVVGLLAGIYLMREYVWPILKEDLLVTRETEVIAQTPFDVILLQVKIGLFLGIFLSIPAFLFFARGMLRDRGLFRRIDIARWKVAVIGTATAFLFLGGVFYGYYLFFPITFSFLANNASSAGLAPTYSIVMWTEFILFLALSFGLAAQLPLVMPALAYSGVIPYESFRDRWKYAVVGIFTFGAVFSPPDPFTQMLWALPLLVLYGFSLYLTKLVVTAKRNRDQVDLRRTLRTRWNVLAGAALLGGAGTYLFLTAGGVDIINDALLPLLPQGFRPAPFRPVHVSWGLSRETAVILATLVGALVLAMVALLVFVYRDLTATSAPTEPGEFGDPTAVDVTTLDAAGVRAAPLEAFADMEEADAVAAARSAMAADDTEKAQAILDRFDEAQAQADAEAESTADTESEPEEGNVFGRTAAGMVDAFREEDTTEEDIGGYYYDLRFIAASLRSRLFRIVAVFGIVMSGTFLALYSGGIGLLLDDFLARLPPGVTREEIPFSVITLHPVEALVFEVKVSVLLGAIATLPFIVYYAWPALRDRGLASGEGTVLPVWGTAIIGGLLLGSAVGYLFVAPTVISWLVYDAVRAGMVISYRVSSFFWLVFLTTAGIGLLFDVPVSMFLFYYGDIVSYPTMRRGWKVFVLGALVLGAVLTPRSVYTMLVVAIPLTLAYLFGLGVLWVVTLGGRRVERGAAPE